jgi:eukaryotic-like serine/threonine-protein kinase
LSPDSQPQFEPRPFPRRFGDRYVLLRPLGEGGMGEVFMGASGRAGVTRVCALKIVRNFHPERDAEDLTQRFLDEAKVVTQLSHENLVYVFDFGIVDRKGYLAMEYVAGKTLTELWNRCAQRRVGFPTGVSLFLAGELLAALAYAHRAGGLSLVHRDISPSNLMVAYTGGVKVIDFGLAKWRAKVSETAAGINWGKLNYMSPEQHQGKTIDHRSDLFSAGVITWELLTGRQLFPNAKARAELREILPPSRFNSSVTPALDLVVLKALRFSPADRFMDGEQMAAALAAEAPRHAGKRQLADFIDRLFSTDRLAEEADQQAMLARVVELGDDLPAGLSSGGGVSGGDPLLGTVLADRYYVKRLVGQGAMGRVYEGHHTGVGKRVAIKIPRHTERRKAILLQRFKREAQAASQIGHVNIADVTDCGTTPSGDFFFVMEFIDGVDLEKLVKRDGAMPLERVLVIGLQIARALEAAHQAGIIHRDLKPSNVMLVRGREEAELVKVLDFGVAKFLRGDAGGLEAAAPVAELTQHDAAVGTPRYMAPEQIGPGREIDFRADIYALGGVLYFMLSGGHAPVEGETVEKVWHRKLNEDPTPLRDHRLDIPEELEVLIMRCLARDPAERPPSMTALKAALVASLERVRSMESALLGARSHSETLIAGRRRWPVALASVAAVALGGTVGAVVWRSRMDVSPANTAQAPATLSLTLGTPPDPPPTAAPEKTSDLPAPQPVASRRASSRGQAHRRGWSPPPQQPMSWRQVAAAARLARGSDVDQLIEEAESKFQTNDLVDARGLAEKAVTLAPTIRTHLLLGKILAGMEEFEEAVESYRRALRIDPTSAPALKGLEAAQAGRSRSRP